MAQFVWRFTDGTAPVAHLVYVGQAAPGKEAGGLAAVSACGLASVPAAKSWSTQGAPQVAEFSGDRSCRACLDRFPYAALAAP